MSEKKQSQQGAPFTGEQEAIYTTTLDPRVFALSEEEKQAVRDAARWQKESAETPWILGQPLDE